MKAARARAGLTLVEVMMATFILGTALVFMVEAATKSIAVASLAKQFETSRRLMGELERLEPLQLEDLEEDTETGTFEGDYREYSWEREITIVGEEDDEVFQIRTRILWETRKGQKYEEVYSLLHLPTAKRAGYVSEDAQNKRDEP